MGTLEFVEKGLRQQKAVRAARGRIERLITQVRVFGVHLAELDFRDQSTKLDLGAQGEVLEELHWTPAASGSSPRAAGGAPLRAEHDEKRGWTVEAVPPGPARRGA